MTELAPFDRMALVAGNFRMVAGLEWAWFLSNQDLPFYFEDLVDYGRKSREKGAPVHQVREDNIFSDVLYCNIGSEERMHNYQLPRTFITVFTKRTAYEDVDFIEHIQEPRIKALFLSFRS